MPQFRTGKRACETPQKSSFPAGHYVSSSAEKFILSTGRQRIRKARLTLFWHSTMLNTALNIVVNGLNTYIGSADPEVIMGNISMVDAYQDSSVQGLTDKVVASIINIEQEGVLRNLPFRRTIPHPTDPDGVPQGVERQPEVYLNVYILFGANKTDYSTALQRISQVIAFFQRKFVFDQTDAPELIPLNVDRLIFDLYSTSFEELNQMWSVNGGKYIPSVMYKMRMAMIQDSTQQQAGIIEEIELQTERI